MAFDSVFNGDPTTPNVTSSGKATFGIDLASGQLYFKDDSVAGWQKTAGGSATSDQIANESVVSGATVTDALNALNTGGSNPIKTVTVTLTAAEVIAVAAGTPFLIQAAPGDPTLGYIVQTAVFAYDYNGEAFSSDMNQLDIGYGAGGVVQSGHTVGFAFNTDGFLSLTQSNFQQAFGLSQNFINSWVVNQDLYFVSNSGSGLTGGTGATLKITVTYIIAPL